MCFIYFRVQTALVCPCAPKIRKTKFKWIPYLTYLLGFRPKSKIWATFGSYSSEGGPVEQINERLKSAGNEPVESVEVNFKPNAEDLVKCYAMGQKIASLVKTLNSAR